MPTEEASLRRRMSLSDITVGSSGLAAPRTSLNATAGPMTHVEVPAALDFESSAASSRSSTSGPSFYHLEAQQQQQLPPPQRPIQHSVSVGSAQGRMLAHAGKNGFSGVSTATSQNTSMTTSSTGSRMSSSFSAGGASTTKITGRRQRPKARRFVVTDIPDEDEIQPRETEDPGFQSPPRRVWDATGDAEPVTDSSTTRRRKGKTEVKGRFTIIDLSPDSPQTSPFPEASAPSPIKIREDNSQASSRAEGSRMRMLRRRLSLIPRVLSAQQGAAPSSKSTGSLPTGVSSGAAGNGGAWTYTSTFNRQGSRMMRPEQPASNALVRELVPPPKQYRQGPPMGSPKKNHHHHSRMGVGMLDHHLEFLQRESSDMRSVVQEMVETNARWLEALAQTGLEVASMVSLSSTSRSGSEISLSDPVMPMSMVNKSPANDEQHAHLQMAYTELEEKYNALIRKNEATETRNNLLEARLEHEMNVSEALRSQLEELTQYTESLMVNFEGPFESDIVSIFDEQSSVDVGEQPLVSEIFSEYDFRYELLKDQVMQYARRRPYDEEEECMSNTSSDMSVRQPWYSKESLGDDDRENNSPFSDLSPESDTSFSKQLEALSADVSDLLVDNDDNKEPAISANQIVEAMPTDNSDTPAVKPEEVDNQASHHPNQTESPPMSSTSSLSSDDGQIDASLTIKTDDEPRPEDEPRIMLSRANLRYHDNQSLSPPAVSSPMISPMSFDPHFTEFSDTMAVAQLSLSHIAQHPM